MRDPEKYLVSCDASIQAAIKAMDAGGVGFAMVTDNAGKILGVISDGDFRRAVLAGVDLTENVLKITNTNFRCLPQGHSRTEAVELFRTSPVRHLPVVHQGGVVGLVTEEDLLLEEERRGRTIDVPAVIMAGGRGRRLDPFTRILPKPLVPIGSRSVIETIMGEFAKFGVHRFYLTLNHKAKLIKAYFEDSDCPYEIEFVDEPEPLGTAGALRYLDGRISSTFFVSNCDIIIDADYPEIHDFHVQSGYDLTIVAAMQHHVVPYGVCRLRPGGQLDTIDEKPEYSFLVNTGMYVLNSDVLSLIPRDTRFDAPDLINALQAKRKKIGAYPIPEKSYVDIGRWEEYRKALRAMAPGAIEFDY
jgi:dTDP-glucose pyrophosphorylase